MMFRRFTVVDHGEYHTGVYGFRQGWPMLPGMHLDFWNDFDISNVVASFGKYQH
jgi:hypothetical protein